MTARELPFVIFALPRSRTAWMGHFLSYGETRVGHDIGVECRQMTDFLVPFENGMRGTVETGSMIAWERIRELMPNVKLAVVKRPIWQVLHSLFRFGLAPQVEDLIRRDELLDEISEQEGTLTLQYDDLEEEASCRKLFEFCLERPFDPEWWNLIRSINIQVNMPAKISQLQQNASHLVKLKADIVKQSFRCEGNA